MLKVILLVIALSPLTAMGCSCVSTAKSINDVINEHDAIFMGVALKTEKTPGDWHTSFYKTKIKVEQIWKGNGMPASVFIKTNIETNSCGGPAPQVGNRFLIFAHKTQDNLYLTGGCSTFMDLNQVEKDLDSLSSEQLAEWQSMFSEMFIAMASAEK